MSEKPLTPRQREMLEFIIDYIDANGYPPSVREIGDGLSLESTSTVHYCLQILVRKGYIEKRKDSPRTIRILEVPA